MSLPEAVIVFGASGFIGRNIVDALSGRVGTIIGVNASGRPVPGCSSTVAASTLDSLADLPRETAIIHVAAFRYFASRFGKQQAEIMRANLAMTDQVYGFAMARGITEVRVASSSAVYPAAWPILDDALPFDLNGWPHDGEAAYAWSKRWGEIAAELWHRRAGVNTISFRLTNPYGPHDTLDEAEAHVATAFVIRAAGEGAEFEVRGNPDAERDFLYAGDAALAFVESLKLRGTQAALNLAYGETRKVSELAQAAMAASGRIRPIKLVSPPPAGNRGVLVRRSTGLRLRQLLPDLPDFQSLESGLEKTLTWYRDALLRQHHHNPWR
ncbi:MAG: NAD(P)-dependent oxidoreductase [Roseomonas sp.]|jgi:nucleoside-diphosphate-sugar epimerase|nr:NAD(P)-dependent oxidoreductase [Roseomonas sp.]MCA3585933.1 NAD(P)-dependent oxidoreductase [Methylocystis sp.]MCA3653694.1 NAD(P)-dependent oxidoreductase [Methylobacterium sp.]MCA3314720.1 NAD(P)-dependent oxidoreductase [Roseomonas sp.]MCA3316633.1 NAD(P)-dependent oxidoreductase [Roseomonas sp.]